MHEFWSVLRVLTNKSTLHLEWNNMFRYCEICYGIASKIISASKVVNGSSLELHCRTKWSNGLFMEVYFNTITSLKDQQRNQTLITYINYRARLLSCLNIILAINKSDKSVSSCKF